MLVIMYMRTIRFNYYKSNVNSAYWKNIRFLNKLFCENCINGNMYMFLSLYNEEQKKKSYYYAQIIHLLY